MAKNLLMLAVSVWLAAVDGTVEKDRQLAEGLIIRLPGLNMPPFVVAVQQPNGSLAFRGGIYFNIVEYAARSLKIPFTFAAMNESLISKLGYNKVMMQMLFTHELDVLTMPLTPSWVRRDVMDYSYPVSIDPYRIMYPWPHEASRLMAPVRPYDPMVWILFFVSLVSTVLFMSVTSGCLYSCHNENRQTTSTQELGRTFLYVVTIALAQGDFLPHRSNPIRVAASGWCLMIVVFINTYSGILSSHLTLPIFEKPINTFQDLADRPDVQLLVPVDSVLSLTLLGAKSGPFKIIGDSLRRNPDSIYKTMDDMRAKLITGKYAYTSTSFIVEYMLAEDYKSVNACRLTLSKTTTYSNPQTFGLAKNGRLNPIIGRQIMRLWEYGLIGRWTDEYRGRYEQCIVKANRPRIKSIQMEDLDSAFILLLIGLAGSVVVFIFERVTGCVRAPKPPSTTPSTP